MPADPHTLDAIRAHDEAHFATIDALRAEVERLRSTLLLALPFLSAAAQDDHHYGSPMLDDPRAFHPDPECSTKEERDAHQAACEAWDRGEQPARPPTHEALLSGEGEPIGWITRQPWGLGTTVFRDEAAVEVYLSAVKVLGVGDAR